MNEATTDTFDLRATLATRHRYQRIAPFYDRMESPMERRYAPWRQRLWSLVQGPRVLEVGVGTGKNMPFYRSELEVTAIDLTPAMLEQARRRADSLNVVAHLHIGDVQALDYPDDTFDAAVATFVFCSVPNPVLGLTELCRVLKSGGMVFLLEHERSANPLVGAIMDLLNPFVVRMMGANINRRTVDNVKKSFLQLERIETVGMGGIVKLISARAM